MMHRGSTLLFVQILLWLFIGSSGQSPGSTCVTNEFESSLLMSYESAVPADQLTQADIDTITTGFIVTYNQIQSTICDDNTILIDSANGTLVTVRRRLDGVHMGGATMEDRTQGQEHDHHPNLHRQLPSNSYILVINMALRGRSRQSSSQVTLFNDAPRRLRRLGAAAAVTDERANVDVFMVKYARWLSKEQNAGKLKKGFVLKPKGCKQH
jgi:hypothetical protein